MRIATLLGSLSRNNGGVSEVARRLSQEIAARGHDVRVVGIRDEFFEADLPGWSPLSPDAVDATPPRSFAYSPALARRLGETGADLCHVHGLWSFPGIAAREWARKRKKPYVVTVHGMLDRWALANSDRKKRIAGILFERKNLNRAACVHAITALERDAIREYGVRAPVCVIPNAVDVPDDTSQSTPPWGDAARGRKVLLYLGRIHPKKGLLPLVEGWAAARDAALALRNEWALVIAGWDQGGFLEILRARVAELNLQDEVIFAGPQFGPAKSAAYFAADAFVLPSFSEGLPLVVLEAWAHRLPVLMTPECCLPVGFERHAALRIDPNPASIGEGLARLAALDDSDRRVLGDNGRRLVATEYTWPAVASEVEAVYRWAIHGGEKPASVEG